MIVIVLTIEVCALSRLRLIAKASIGHVSLNRISRQYADEATNERLCESLEVKEDDRGGGGSVPRRRWPVIGFVDESGLLEISKRNTSDRGTFLHSTLDSTVGRDDVVVVNSADLR